MTVQAGEPVRSASVVLDLNGLQGLIDELSARGYQVVGPTVRNQAIVYDRVESIDHLPRGWTEEQDAASYRLKRRDDEALFGFNVGPHSWKQFLFPPNLRVWRGHRTEHGFTTDESDPETPRYAFFGVRSCDLHAIAIQDRVFMGGSYQDPAYRTRRDDAFVVAINCGQAGESCFCVSMGTGPRARSGFDIALTEVLDERRHEFVAEAGSERGAEVLSAMDARPATVADADDIERITAVAVNQMGRSLDTTGLRELLFRNLEHPRWDEVATRCLTCGNCTMVCPTCFCATFEETSALDGSVAERWRQWDSCFTVDHSYLHGGSVRKSGRSRYRQWMTHKLASWWDQFGTSGCVGCGRCITWCPVGIDITEEVRAIRQSDEANASAESSREGASS